MKLILRDEWSNCWTLQFQPNQETELLSGPHSLDIHTIATALENPLGFLYDEPIRC